MVEKPNADIEWYDDGFSIEEQSQLREESLKRKKAQSIKIKVTENYHQTMQEKIISDLRTKLAADEAYIQELEEDLKDISNPTVDTITRLKSEKKNLEKKLQEIQKDPATELGKSHLIIKTLQKKIDRDTKEIEAPFKEKIAALEQEVKSLKITRDSLLSRFYGGQA